MVPSLDSLIYLSVFKDVHCPFHFRRISKFASSCMSGNQKPESYSFSPVTITCPSRSSLVLEGLPGLRCCFSSASSSLCRFKWLDIFSSASL